MQEIHDHGPWYCCWELSGSDLLDEFHNTNSTLPLAFVESMGDGAGVQLLVACDAIIWSFSVDGGHLLWQSLVSQDSSFRILNMTSTLGGKSPGRKQSQDASRHHAAEGGYLNLQLCDRLRVGCPLSSNRGLTTD